MGQCHRLKAKVTRSKNVSWEVPLTSKSHVYGHAKEETQEYDVGCFQSVCVFFSFRMEAGDWGV